MSLPKPYYSDGSVTIYHSPCELILPFLGQFDLLLTDPPYGYNYESNHTCPTTTAKWMNKPIHGDESTELRDLVIRWAGQTPWAVFGSWKMAKPAGVRGVLIWDKGPASGMGDLTFPWKGSHEEIYISGQGWEGSRDEGVIKDKWIVTRKSMGREHPNEKPLNLIVYLLSKHTGKRIIDPFAGSCTTGRAAKDLGRQCVLIEREERYCEIGAKRMEQECLPFTESINTPTLETPALL